MTNQVSKNSNNYGKIFEKEFANSVPENVFMQRMKDDILHFKNVQNSCDFILFRYPILFLLELKSTKQKALPFSNVSQYQIDSLHLLSKQEGIVAGFIINFRELGYKTYFVSAETIYHFYNNADRKSFPHDWVQEMGILLPATLIRTRYRLDLSELFERR